MKKTFFFLSFLILNSFLRSAVDEPNPVRDIDGNELQTDDKYYILPAMSGFGGGLTFGKLANDSETCPSIVVQARLEVEPGHPFTFTPVNAKEGVVRVSTDLNIKFNAKSLCMDSNVWHLMFPLKIGQYVISTNGIEGKPGIDTLGNWFKIEVYNKQDYKFVFCPTICSFCKHLCKDVGLYIGKNKTRRLTLSDEPFRINFKKVERIEE